MQLLRVSGLFTGTEEIVDAGLVISNARIVAVGPYQNIRSEHETLPVQALHGVAFPGLVNAHTHLELSGLHGKIAKGLGFLPWLDVLMALPRERDDVAVHAACASLRTYATDVVGEITNSRNAVPHMLDVGLAGIAFDEVFGLDEARTQARVDELVATPCANPGTTENVDPVRAQDQAHIRSAITPHALHSVHPSVLRRLAALPGPLSVHLAEYPEERRFLTHGDGPLADWLAARGPLPTCPRQGSVHYAQSLGLLRKGTLAVHLTDATPEELVLVRDAGAIAVLCPRSNLYIEGKLPPLADMIRLGVPFALGTDSLASNDSLDVLEEARVLFEAFPEVSPKGLLQSATHTGACALGFPKHGIVGPGTTAYFVEGTLGKDTPCTFLLKNTARARRKLS
jgi:aminodeoxyfutalosine deaminase